MPIIKSAKKRVRTANKAAVRNSKTKRTVRSAVKAFSTSLNGGKNTPKSFSEAQSAIDKAAKRGVMHKNKAARKKRQLAAAAKAAGVKTTGTPKTKTASKPAAKAPVKKAPAKKPAAKRPTAKK